MRSASAPTSMMLRNDLSLVVEDTAISRPSILTCLRVWRYPRRRKFVLRTLLAGVAALMFCASSAWGVDWAFAKVVDLQTPVQDSNNFSAIDAPTYDGANLAFVGTINGAAGVYTAG